ncbi:MAG: histidine kinase [Clostridiaceae bacterium]|nr:histidine kinase [Clostridiaceae bacterium]
MQILTQVICAILAGGILVYLATNGRRNRSSFSYMLCIGLLLLWHIAEIVLMLSRDPVQEMIALKIKFLPVVYIGVSWLYFCLATVHSKWVEKKTFVWTLFAIPALFYLFMITHEFHHLFFKEVIFKTKIVRGPVFWLHTAESYYCIFYGSFYLFAGLKKKFGRTTRENLLLLIAVMLPMAANIIMLIEIIPNRGMDITSQVMLLTMIFFGVAVYQKGFLDLIPVAARHFIENTSVGIIIIDNENLVVGVNDAINRLLPELQLKIYDPVDKITRYIRKNCQTEAARIFVESMEGKPFLEPVRASMKLKGLDLNLEGRVLTGFNQSATGRLLVVEDRSEEQQLLSEIREKNLLLTKTNEELLHSNSLLTKANSRLERFSITIEELAISRERNRVGREVHDTVGHTLTLLVALAENAKLKLTEDQVEIRDTLDKSIDLSRQALNDIRSCLKGICLESFKSTELAEWMSHLVKTNASSGTIVEYSISSKIPPLDAARVMAIYRVCQESVTNAIRHGQAHKVNIIIKSQQNMLRLYVFDDGKGCRAIKKGYGLTGMEERIAMLNGSISFGSDGEKGFNIIAELPLPK